MARPRKERVTADLKRFRDELVETLKSCKPEEFDWKPRPDMKSVKDMLRECGAVERWFITLARDGQRLEFEKAVRWSGEDLQSTLADLEKIRRETLEFLDRCTEADLEKTHKVSADRELETEEIFRLVARHEYYHLGQIIYNRWQLGYNPYKTEQTAQQQSKK